MRRLHCRIYTALDGKMPTKTMLFLSWGAYVAGYSRRLLSLLSVLADHDLDAEELLFSFSFFIFLPLRPTLHRTSPGSGSGSGGQGVGGRGAWAWAAACRHHRQFPVSVCMTDNGIPPETDLHGSGMRAPGSSSVHIMVSYHTAGPTSCALHLDFLLHTPAMHARWF